MEDIRSKEDIAFYVTTFYQKVQKDRLIGPIFAQRIESDQWPDHLDKMTNFWASVLFQERGYKGNPFQHHIRLQIGKPHFDRWIALFNQTISENFEGPKAEEAMMRASSIRKIFENKLNYLSGAKDLT